MICHIHFPRTMHPKKWCIHDPSPWFLNLVFNVVSNSHLGINIQHEIDILFTILLVCLILSTIIWVSNDTWILKHWDVDMVKDVPKNFFFFFFFIKWLWKQSFLIISHNFQEILLDSGRILLGHCLYCLKSLSIVL